MNRRGSARFVKHCVRRFPSRSETASDIRMISKEIAGLFKSTTAGTAGYNPRKTRCSVIGNPLQNFAIFCLLPRES